MLNNSFKPIKNYEDYLVNENGEVFSTKRNKLLSPRDNGCGYLKVTLWKNGKYKHFLIHRLVAMAFLNNSNNLPQVNHIDGNKLNNNISNLEWCDSKQNNQHAWKLGLKENTRAAARQNFKNAGKIYGKINCKYAHEACIKHLNPELKELFDDLFIFKLKIKDICNKYNLSQPYVSQIKNKQRLQTAFHEYEKLYLFHTQK